MTASEIEIRAMRRAIALSAHGLGRTSPNPPVGCVILDAGGRPVGEGYHERKGGPHAEVHALAAAGDRARGGTAVVTLEPCNHHGRTPPCRGALIDAGIVRTVISVIDPTSREEGGAARLRAAGVDVEVGVLADEARLVLGGWLQSLEAKRPTVTWAYVYTVDGQVVPASEHLLQELSLADIVIDAEGRVREALPGSHGADVFTVPTEPSQGDPDQELADLYAGGARSVVLAVGEDRAAPFLEAGLIDRVTVFLDSDGPTRPSPASNQMSMLPLGFMINAITSRGHRVQVDAAVE